MVIPIALMRLLGKKSGTRLSQGELVMWLQDLAVSALASSAYVAFFGLNPAGWGAVAVGAITLGITWAKSLYKRCLT